MRNTLKTSRDIDNTKMFAAYDATRTSPHRQSPPTKIIQADKVLNKTRRKKGAALVQEQMTNSALLNWIVRKHLDYVSRFEINFRSGFEDLDREMKGLIQWHRRAKNFDFTGRHNRNQWMRIFETGKVVHGDAAGIMIKGGTLQGIDSTRISKPDEWGDDPPDQEKIDATSDFGLILDSDNRVQEYCVCVRNTWGRLIFDHFEPAENMLFDGYFTNFDQTRAHSPLLAAMNDCVDLADISLYTKINLKLKNIFGVAVFREIGDQLGNSTETNDDGDEEVEFSPDQINILDLDQNDKVEAIETNSPGANSMEFMDKLSRIVMLALDIPFTSLDSSRASFSARIADRAEYEESAEGKREKNADILRQIYAWRIEDWYRSNRDFKAAVDASDYDPKRIIRKLDIIPAGTPWMDKLNEVKGDILAVALGIESVPRIARKRGLDAYEVGAEQAEYLAWARENELPIFYAAGGQEAVQSMLDDDDENNEGENNETE
jgi:hypothetical protein